MTIANGLVWELWLDGPQMIRFRSADADLHMPTGQANMRRTTQQSVICKRREFLTTTASGLGMAALGSMLTDDGLMKRAAAEVELANPLAAKEPHFDAKAKALSKAGLDLKTTQSDKKTVWHLAMDKNDLALLKKVQAFGADINAKDEQGNTVLHYAAMKSRNTDILKYLVANGADITSTTAFGETAYDLAQENELLAKNNVNLDFLNQ